MAGTSGDRSGHQRPDGGRCRRPTADRGSAGRRGAGATSGGRRDARPSRGAADKERRSAEQERYDGPPLPDDITGRELDRSVQQQLRSLPEKLALRVARHLVAAASLVDTDPETAYRHTLAARARASRVTAVREACGETAYAAGKFKESLADLKAARRMGGSAAYLALMADCERGMGRPRRALDITRDPAIETLDVPEQIEVRIVASGARRDLGDTAGAVRALEGRELRTTSRDPWVARLRYAYAEALLADGRTADAREWFERAAGVDSEGLTDALERIDELSD